MTDIIINYTLVIIVAKFPVSEMIGPGHTDSPPTYRTTFVVGLVLKGARKVP